MLGKNTAETIDSVIHSYQLEKHAKMISDLTLEILSIFFKVLGSDTTFAPVLQWGKLTFARSLMQAPFKLGE